MLVTSAISIGIKFRTAVLTPRLCTSIKMYSTSTGSSSGSSSGPSSGSSSGSSSESSSDSSDSDSDTENPKKIEPVKTASATELDMLVDNLISLKDKKRIDVSMPARKIIKQDKPPIQKNVSHEKQLSQAVHNITDKLSKNKEEIKTQLLDRLTSMSKNNSKIPINFSKNIENIVLNRKSSFSQESENVPNDKQWKYKADIARKLNSNYKPKQQEKKEESGHIWELLKNDKNKQNQARRKQKETKLKADESRKRIFNKIEKPTTTIPELSMWDFLEKRELDLIVDQPSKNIFQEMIQWTESGKLWKFPIDNEIGMEEESNVHFTEHVFLERHLKDWCPTTGPIRHFMELVCVGLSKNPYMTVQEKTDHIAWYKEYFKEKKEILLELGAIKTTSDTTKQITS